MMRSMFSGVSGLRIHQTKMDVIANNISNVNTTGFKSSRVTFAEIFSQTVSGASGANDRTGRGGVNPMQIGLGGTVASIDLQMRIGAAQRTDNPFDLMIQGEGFFIVGDGNGRYFTRAGVFSLDEANNLVAPNGLVVQGWDRTYNYASGVWEVNKNNLVPISLTGDKQVSEARATNLIEWEGNLNATENVNDEHVASMAFFDSVGNRYVATVRFTYNGPFDFPDPDSAGDTFPASEWQYTIDPTVYLDGDREKPLDLAMIIGDGDLINDPGTGTVETSRASGYLYFNTNGKLIGTGTGESDNATPPVITVTASQDKTVVLNLQSIVGSATQPVPVSTLVTGDSIRLDFSSMTQYGSMQTTGKSYAVNGNTSGTLIGVSIGTDGKITGRYSNGDMELLSQIPIAIFRNPAGLEKVGDNLYVPTVNSGEFKPGDEMDVTATGGKLMGGVLEMSNVDLANEFTEMITTQRGFQANSRVITVSDDMLQELVNLKR